VQNKRRAEIAKKLKETKEEEDQKKGKKKKRTMGLMLEQAGLTISVKQYWIYSAASMVACVIIAKMTGQVPFVVVMAAVIGLFGVPRFVLRFLTKRRQKKFLSEFADALEAIIRLLKAGMPVSEAIAMISREFTGPWVRKCRASTTSRKSAFPFTRRRSRRPSACR
jgi:tight adherence protein B